MLNNTMFGKIQNGMCRLSMNGQIAIKTSNGYKAFNAKTGRLTNCDNFAFDIGSDFFFVIPTNHVKRGDIILADGKPRCVLEATKNEIKTFNYENSEISTLVPERHVMFGKNYFYGKIVSMFGSDFSGGKKNNNIFKYMMLSSMMKGDGANPVGGMGDMSKMMPMMMLMNGGGDFFGDMFDMDMGFEDEEEDESVEDAEMED